MKKGIFTGLVAAAILASVCLAGCGGETAACEHEFKAVARKDATCAEAGNIAHYRCDKCDRVFFDQKGSVELTEESLVIGKLPHSIEHCAAFENSAYSHGEYWHCFACGKYFSDADLQTETTRSALFSYNAVRLTDVETGGNIYLSSEQMPSIREDFTFRCFIGWTNNDGVRLSKETQGLFPNSGKAQIYINLNRECTLSGTGWYNFGVGYNAKEGLFYKKLQSVDSVAAPENFTQLFLEQGGIYVIVVRRGSNVTFYFEDKDGKPQRMGSNNEFGKTDALIRLAANSPGDIAGWKAVVNKTAICIGVGDPECVFDKAYEND